MAKNRLRTRPKAKAKPVVSPALIGVVSALAILIVAALIWWNLPSSSTDLSRFPTKGDPNAPVTLVDFSDYG